jgi:hypothetical protein
VASFSPEDLQHVAVDVLRARADREPGVVA